MIRQRFRSQIMLRTWSGPGGSVRWLLLIALVGALWRLGYVVAFTLDNPLLLNDSLYYSMQAGRNADGDWFRHLLTDQPGAEHPPLTSLYLTPWSIGDDYIRRQRLAIAVLGCFTVPVIGLAARRVWRTVQRPTPVSADAVGLLAAAIAAVYPPLWINDLVVMSETPAMLAVAGALWAGAGYVAHPTVGRAALVGLLVGVATLARSELALCAVGFAAVLIATAGRPDRRLRSLAAVVVLSTALVVVAPWALYNLSRFDRPTLLSTNDGATLLGANCDASYYDLVGHWVLPCLMPFDELDGVASDASVVSAGRRTSAFGYAREHLDRVPVVVAARVGRVLDVYGVRSMVANDVGEDKPEWAVWVAVGAWWFAAAGAVAGWCRLRVLGAAVRWWLLIPQGVAICTAIVFYGAHRIRAPAEPAVVILAAIAAADLLRRGALAPPAGAVDEPPTRSPIGPPDGRIGDRVVAGSAAGDRRGGR